MWAPRRPESAAAQEAYGKAQEAQADRKQQAPPCHHFCGGDALHVSDHLVSNGKHNNDVDTKCTRSRRQGSKVRARPGK